MWKAVEVTLIWAVAIVLAVPEAIAFDMVELWVELYRDLWVCMLASEQKSSFMMVRTLPHPGCSTREARANGASSLLNKRLDASADGFQASG